MTARIERPLSPHIQTYRWTLTMILSIVHRATGMALYVGTLLLAWWLIAAASGPTAYANVQGQRARGPDLGRVDRRHLADGADLDRGLCNRRRTMSTPTGHGSPSMRTPLGKVRNLGASHSGTGDFWRQRLTAVAMVLLIIPVLVIVMMLLGRNQAGAAQILGSMPIAVILVLFIIASTWHMKIGMQVVIEDYIHNEKLKLASVMANNFFCFVVALASIYAIFKLSSGV
jgi:succinate dehydrogenase / fumarate reductase membrane anchor subunit